MARPWIADGWGRDLLQRAERHLLMVVHNRPLPGPDEFFQSATTTTLFSEVTAALLDEVSDEAVDPYRAARDRDWSSLREKVVGFEVD